MAREKYLEKITQRVLDSEKGKLFVVSDFADIAPSQVIRKSLTRLIETNTLRRIMRGIYEYPKYSELLQTYAAPSVDNIAKALARNNNWKIAPAGNAAQNMLGLSTQVPSSHIYVTDGPYKEYQYGKFTIIFKHVSNKNIANMSPITMLIVQALKSIGKDQVDEMTIAKLKTRLSEDQKKIVCLESRGATAWISDTIQHVCCITD